MIRLFFEPSAKKHLHGMLCRVINTTAHGPPAEVPAGDHPLEATRAPTQCVNGRMFDEAPSAAVRRMWCRPPNSRP